jgi:hypothetical protein
MGEGAGADLPEAVRFREILYRDDNIAHNGNFASIIVSNAFLEIPDKDNISAIS